MGRNHTLIFVTTQIEVFHREGDNAVLNSGSVATVPSILGEHKWQI